MKLLKYLPLLLLLMNCENEAEKKADKKEKDLVLAEESPFNVGLNESYDYKMASGEDIENFVEYTIEESLDALNKIKNQKEPTFENTFVAYDNVYNELQKANNNSFMLYWSSTDSIVRAKGLEYSQKLDSLNTVITSDKELFKQFEAFAKSDSYKELKGHRKLLVDDLIDDFKHAGVNLDEDKLAKVKTLKAEITDLSAQYSTNMNTANAVLKLDEDGAEGLPESFKDKYRTSDSLYEIPVMPATKGPVMDNAVKEETRKQFTTLYSNRGADKNLDILNQLVQKRYELGKLMGYKSFADYNLSNKMAKNPETVWKFIRDLASESKEKAIADVAELKTFKNKTLKNSEPLNAWDINYYHNQILKSKYNVDHEKIREYLPMDEVLKGMFELYQELLGVQFKKIENASVWHEEVQAYEVYDGEKLKGRFYLDLYPRPNKESWFYGVPLSYGKQTKDGYEVPVSMLLGNFTKPTENMPSLLSHDELETLFHEFGHIMDAMAYEGEFSLQARTKSDFVEAMSQIFENWIWDYDILSSFAKHYKTGEVLPKEVFDNMLKAKTFSSGLFAQSSLRSAIYDMNLYDKYSPDVTLDTDQLWRNVDLEMEVMPWYIEGTHPQASWIHINTHPTYYYGYLWSNVYSQDMFTVFKKNGLRDQNTGVKYRKMIMANGSQRPVDEAVEEFLGRPMNNEAYIKSLGLE